MVLEECLWKQGAAKVCMATACGHRGPQVQAFGEWVSVPVVPWLYVTTRLASRRCSGKGYTTEDRDADIAFRSTPVVFGEI